VPVRASPKRPQGAALRPFTPRICVEPKFVPNVERSRAALGGAVCDGAAGRAVATQSSLGWVVRRSRAIVRHSRAIVRHSRAIVRHSRAIVRHSRAIARRSRGAGEMIFDFRFGIADWEHGAWRAQANAGAGEQRNRGAGEPRAGAILARPGGPGRPGRSPRRSQSRPARNECPRTPGGRPLPNTGARAGCATRPVRASCSRDRQG